MKATTHTTPPQKTRQRPSWAPWRAIKRALDNRAEARRLVRETREEDERLADQAAKLVEFIRANRVELAFDRAIGEYTTQYGRENVTVRRWDKFHARVEVKQRSSEGEYVTYFELVAHESLQTP
jgi:hypothetical protein